MRRQCLGDGGGRRFFTTAIVAGVCRGVYHGADAVFLASACGRCAGGGGTLLEATLQYGVSIAAGCPMFVAETLLTSFLRHDRAPRWAMIGVLSGGVANIALDWVSMYPLKMGLAGAGLAAALGATLTMAVILTHFRMPGRFGGRGWMCGDYRRWCISGTGHFAGAFGRRYGLTFQPVGADGVRGNGACGLWCGAGNATARCRQYRHRAPVSGLSGVIVGVALQWRGTGRATARCRQCRCRAPVSGLSGVNVGVALQWRGAGRATTRCRQYRRRAPVLGCCALTLALCTAPQWRSTGRATARCRQYRRRAPVLWVCCALTLALYTAGCLGVMAALAAWLFPVFFIRAFLF